MKIAVAGATGRVGSQTVDILRAQGHEVVEMSRSTGVDLITGEGLADALRGVESIVDAATGPSPDEKEATDFFVTAAQNLQTGESEVVSAASRVARITIHHGGDLDSKLLIPLRPPPLPRPAVPAGP